MNQVDDDPHLSCEDWRKVVGFAAKNVGLGVGETLSSWKLCYGSLAGDFYGVAEEVTRQVMLKCLTCIQVPVFASYLVHLLDAFRAFWLEEGLIKHPKVFVP